jgi:hypothetical protein
MGMDDIKEIVIADPLLETQQECNVSCCQTILADVALDLFHLPAES